MDALEPRIATLESKMHFVNKLCERENDLMVQNRLDANSDAYLLITREQEQLLWDFFKETSAYIVRHFLPAEKSMESLSLYLIPELVVTVSPKAEYYDAFKTFRTKLLLFNSLRLAEKTQKILKVILNKLHTLAMYYRRMATIREMHRRDLAVRLNLTVPHSNK